MTVSSDTHHFGPRIVSGIPLLQIHIHLFLLPPPHSIMATDTKNDKVFVIGTRRSQLALAQAYIVRDTLAKAYPDYEFKIEAMATTGDRILNVALNKIGEKSLFTKELETALHEGRVDLVVHSLKDLPTVMEPGMVLGGVSERESPDDALVLAERHVTAKTYTTIDSLPAGAVVGTSSLRRTAQIKRKRPDLEIVSVVKYHCIQSTFHPYLLLFFLSSFLHF